MKRRELTVLLWLFIILDNWLLSTNMNLVVKTIAVIVSFLIVTGWIAFQLRLVTGSSLVKLTVLLLISWIIILPLGGLGITSYLILTLPIPSVMLQFIYIHRLLLVLILLIMYVVFVLGWWAVQPVIFGWIDGAKTYEQVPLRKSVISWLIDVVVGGILIVIGQAYLLMIGGTLLLASTVSLLLARYFQFDIVSRHWGVPAIGAVICVLAIFSWGHFQPKYPNNYDLKIIAHRGVDNGNGVQNTASSLKKTSKHFHRVEMDIQETSDHKFVCLHDPNLDHLAHRSLLAKNQKLSSLTKIKVSENGHQTTLTSFDDYLRVAKQTHTKLIVEIKPQVGISSRQSAREFAKRYHRDIDSDQLSIHSVDDSIIEQLRKESRTGNLGLIRPFILSRLQTNQINFYSLNYHAINPAYVRYLHEHNIKIYAWTVDSPNAARRMVALNVDGIITNNAHLIQHKVDNVHDGLKYDVQNFLLQLI